MAIFLAVLARKTTPFQKHAKIYSTLFALCAFTLTLLPIHEQNHTKKIDKVLAAQISSTDIVSLDRFDENILRPAVQIDVPLIGQYPELPRGCEVTSLAMLLQYHNIQVDKMTLAKEVKKDPAKYKVKDGKVHFGHPNKGFVGNMYTLSEPGYGVYHKPIANLAKKYAGDRVHDLTGKSFYKVLQSVNRNEPVFVITNAKYKKLPSSAFTTWETSQGPVKITMQEHAVVITGYDKDYIYFNDPLKREKKAPFDDFKAAWVQMGKQAITITLR
nr:C39 family peptidase [Salirhabdus salicampi]